ncbi:MAG: GNAT family N-acetyltransferase [Gammaproteobacteria bacterium]|nr:GNAT family N-acetyltransferase [Gammaproteobacteria bacterium]
MRKTDYTKLQDQIIFFREIAKKNGHRLPVAFQTCQESLSQFAEQVMQSGGNAIFVDKTNALKANDIIGHEYDLIVLHLHAAFDPNLMAAISGTLKSGGLFLVLIPDDQSANNGNTDNPFYQYILSAIHDENSFLRFTLKGEHLDIIPPSYIAPPSVKHDIFSPQKTAIETIKKVASGRSKRPLTITADRGRGKSAAIGIAIGQLISSRTMNIIITAPSLAASAVIFKHIKLTLPNAKISTGHVTFENSQVCFVAPDNLLTQFPDTDLLVVDEAAGHNLFTLEALLQHYSRIIFSTTLHGYEGSGQGFITRFSKKLDTLTPQWKSIKLEQPIRWQTNDPLEAFIDRTFMLSVEPQLPNLEIDIPVSDIETRLSDNKNLVSDEEQLKCIFSLLKSAHYKTTPNDLRQLMNSNNLTIFTSYYKDTLIAAAITETEGRLDSDLIDDIYNGYRRPKGELLPQSIVMHLGLPEAGSLQYLRIVRIAVLPDLQENKIGSTLLASVIEYAEENKFDFVGCSFGATTRLLKFWLSFNFRALRVGYKKNAFSGCNAILLAKPLSATAKKITIDMDGIFFDNFVAQLSASLNDLDASIVSIILKNTCQNENKTELTKRIADDVTSFSQHNRSYDDNLSSINYFIRDLTQTTHCLNTLTEKQLQLVILKVFQNKSWEGICKKIDIQGKKQGLSELKLCLSSLISYCQAARSEPL